MSRTQQKQAGHTVESEIKCGCRLWYPTSFAGSSVPEARVHYCPMHKAAPSLLEAAKNAVRIIEAQGRDTAMEETGVMQLRAAIRLAEGGE